MFQTFGVQSNPDQGPPRLAELRDWMTDQKVDGFLVPRADKHQGEYVAPCDERLAWLTGFTGSAGFACVLANQAGVFIDGRYRVQVKTQVADVFTPVPWPEVSLSDWIIENSTHGDVIGFDPWLHTVDEIAKLEAAVAPSGVTLRACQNGVDAVWHDRPTPPTAAAFAHPINLSGERSPDKRTRIAAHVAHAGHAGVLLTLPDSICWLLNMRGADIPRTPIVQCFAILHDTGRVSLFGDVAKFDPLGPDPDIDVLEFSALEQALAGIEGRIAIDPASCPHVVTTLVPTSQIAHMPDPCALPKACKNEIELAGTRAAHIRDGAAMCKFLHWLDTQDTAQLTEIDIATALEGFRAQDPTLHDISFETISGSGPNGAIVHYRVSEHSNRPLDTNSLLLVDSGAQYPDGTTDITRTLPLGAPTDAMKHCFTRVLQGMIALSRARFPMGLSGRDLDALARAPLWMDGMDYDHGTGHGVGSFLSVHEGPQRISRTHMDPLLPGMIVSNEPGYYREGAFGIRIENLIVVQKALPLDGGDDRAMLDFETLTLAPIDTRLLKSDLLSPSERDWLNAYHRKVYDNIAPLLDRSCRDWLSQVTKPI